MTAKKTVHKLIPKWFKSFAKDKKKIPLIGMRPIEVAVLFLILIMIGSTSAYVLDVSHTRPVAKVVIASKSSTTATSSGNGAVCKVGSPSCPGDSSTPATTSTPSTPATTTSPQSSSDSTTSGCTMKTLPPPPTTYEDTNSLPQGQTEQVTTGTDGLETICNGKPSVLEGDSPVVWVGTGTSSGSSTTEQPQANTNQGSEQEYEDCMQSVQSQAEVDNGLSPYEEQEAQAACSRYL